ADFLERIGAVRDDSDDVRQRLDVVDDGRFLVQPANGQPRRPVAGIAALALDRRDQRGGLAAHVAPGAAIDDEVAGKTGVKYFFAKITGGVSLLQRARETAVGQV